MVSFRLGEQFDTVLDCGLFHVFSDDDLGVMERIRRVFDPHGLMNPGKVFPAEGLAASRSPYPPRLSPRRGAAIGGDEPWV